MEVSCSTNPDEEDLIQGGWWWKGEKCLDSANISKEELPGFVDR